MRNEVIAELTQLAEKDERIMVATADLGFNVLNVFSDKFPERYINVGIAEQNLTSIAAGVALEGNMVFTYSIGNFPTLRCIEQIRNLVCYHNANVKILAVGGGFAYGSLGMTHHATEDIAMMRSLPHMNVYVPGDAIEAVKCLHDLYSYDGPAYLRMARGKEECVHKNADFNVKKIIGVAQDGFDVCIFSAGTILTEAVKLQKMLSEKGILSSVFSVPMIKPIDSLSIIKIAQKSRMIVTMEEHNIIGGLGGAISEVISSLPKHAPLLRLGLQDTFTSEVGSQTYLRDYYKVSATKAYKIILEALRSVH